MMISSQPLTFEILHSIDSGVRRTTEAPRRPWSQRGRISGRTRCPSERQVPLQSRANASPFWIMFLLSSGTFEREIIEVEPYAHLLARFLAYTSRRASC